MNFIGGCFCVCFELRYLLLTMFDCRAVSATSIYGLSAKHEGRELKWKKQGTITLVQYGLRK